MTRRSPARAQSRRIGHDLVVNADPARPIAWPTRHAVIAACLALAACNQASPTPPAPSASGAPTARATTVPAVSAAASPGSSNATPTASSGAAPPSPRGSAASVEASPDALRLVESGFTAFAADGNDFASFAAIIDNPNAAWAVFQMQLTIDFFDADDAFIAGEELFVQVLPGQRTAIAGEAFGAGGAARMVVTLPDDTSAFERSRLGRDLFAISDVSTSRRDGLNLARGRLTSRAADTQSLVQLTAVYRNGRGDIIGGAVGGVDSIAPGATLTFEVIDGAPYPAISDAEVFWQMSGIRR
jgi:hypothetical protein